MKVLEWLMAFVVKNDVAVMIGAFVLLIVWGIGNILPNIYRKQIAAMEKCRRLIIADSDKTALHVRFLPDEYRRQRISVALSAFCCRKCIKIFKQLIYRVAQHIVTYIKRKCYTNFRLFYFDFAALLPF